MGAGAEIVEPEIGRGDEGIEVLDDGGVAGENNVEVVDADD